MIKTATLRSTQILHALVKFAPAESVGIVILEKCGNENDDCDELALGNEGRTKILKAGARRPGISALRILSPRSPRKDKSHILMQIHSLCQRQTLSFEDKLEDEIPELDAEMRCLCKRQTMSSKRQIADPSADLRLFNKTNSLCRKQT